MTAHYAIVLSFVASLTGLLGHDEYPVRQKSQDLLAIIPAAYPFLKAGLADKSAEVAQRCRLALASPLHIREKIKEADRIRPRYPVMPWIDGWHEAQGVPYEMQAAYIRRVQAKNGRENYRAPLWQDSRDATRLLVRDLYLAGKPVAYIRRVLESLVVGELKWIEWHGEDYAPHVLPPKGWEKWRK